MHLKTKLLLFISLILFVAFASLELVSYQAVKQNAIYQLWEQAEKVRNLLMAYRRTQQHVFLDNNVPLTEQTLPFLPAYALGKISEEYVNWDKTGFSFNNVSDKPRNPDHMADAVELEAMAYFREHDKEKLLFKPFINAKGENYYLYARPIWIKKHCIKCHGNREDAPETIRKLYDKAWGYKIGDLRGIMSIKLPATTVKDRITDVFKKDVLIHLVAFIAIFIFVILFMRNQITRPLECIILGMQAVAKGDYNQNIKKLTGDFKIMGDTFNNMAKQINAQQQALQGFNSTLEDRVQIRTKELEQANQQIKNLNTQLESENLRMSSELEVTKRLQQMLLPKTDELQKIQELDIAGYMAPADEVGGDYYDVLEHDGNIKISIGDVTGHGLESGVLMLMVQVAVRTLLINNVTDPKAFLNTVNQVIFANIQRLNSDKNLTLALLDYQKGNLQVTGQHEEVLVVRQNGDIERIDTFDLGFMVGLEPDISHFIQHKDIQLKVGDGIVLYTDGITECFNETKQLYGIERLCDLIGQIWSDHSALEISEQIIDNLAQFAGTQKPNDDIALLVIKRTIET